MSSQHKIPLRAVLFDKDGTLLDFEKTWLEAYRRTALQLAGEWGHTPQFAQTLMEAGGYDPVARRCAPDSALACGSGADIARVWAAAAGRPDTTGFARELDRRFVSEVARTAQPTVPDLPDVLGRLRSAGFRLGLATMDSEAGAQAFLDASGTEACFDFVAGYDSGYGAKPAPGMVRAFCRKLRLAPAEVVMVGDTMHDINMGRNGGCGLVAGVLTGAGDAVSLASADCLVANVAELTTRLIEPPNGAPA